MDIEEVVEKLRKYGINATEKELMEKEKKRLIKSLRDAYEGGYIGNVLTALRELEGLEKKQIGGKKNYGQDIFSQGTNKWLYEGEGD